MKQLLDSNLEIFLDSGFIYLPLLFDPEIEKEARDLLRLETSGENSGQSTSNILVKHKGKHFVKALGIQSLIENYEAIDAYSYQRLRNECLQKYQLEHDVDSIFLDETLRTILFRVMPHFIRKNRGLQRKRLTDEELLDLIGDKIDIPEKYYKEAEAFRDLKPLEEIARNLEDQKPIVIPAENGPLSACKLRDWLHGAIESTVLVSEYERIAKSLQVRKQFSQAKPEHIATLLFIGETGALEIDGFGFIRRTNAYKEYHIYKRTGDYVLKDYYARSYLFPDCRVAVSTYSPFKPFVMEKYKHPFLIKHKSKQEICMKNFVPSDDITAENIIRTIEEGLTALRYGYDGRRRNGYHSLDRTWVHIPTIEFAEYRI